MAGLRSNSAWWAIQKQTTAGTAAAGTAASVYKIPFAGGSIGPVRETDRLSETDSSIDQGDPYVSASGVEGSPEAYARDAYLPLLLHGALNGAITTTGAADPYTHTIDAGTNALPLFTIWKNIGGTDTGASTATTGKHILEQYVDCRVGSLTISGEAGSPLTVACGIQGRIPTRLDAGPGGVASNAINTDPVYTFSHSTDYVANPDTSLITIGATGIGTTFRVRSFELTVENNLSRQQTNSVYPLDTAPGIREVSLGFDLIFEDRREYDLFHYGAAGTAGPQEISPNIYTISTSTTFTFRRQASPLRELTFTIPKIAYEEFPVEADPGGDPIVVPVRAVALRNTPIVSASVKNGLAGTAYASA